MTRLTCALGPDSAGTLLHRFIRGASERLDAALYEVGPSYGWMFPNATERGVDVRLLLDGHGGANRGCLEELHRAAQRGAVVPCRMLRHHSGEEAHWKLLIADSGGLALGTGNLIGRDAPADRENRVPPDCTPHPGTREWWAFVDGAPTLVGLARQRINAAWRRASAPPRLWPLAEAAAAPPVGSPTPAVPPLELEMAARRLRLVTEARAVQGMLEAELEAVGARVLVTVPYMHTWSMPVRPLLDRLAALSATNCDVRVLLGGHPSGGDAATLMDRGIRTRVMNAERCTTGHAKGLVADDVVVITSANWSSVGLGSSLEAALRVDHAQAAGYYADAFERDWDSADPLPLRAR